MQIKAPEKAPRKKAGINIQIAEIYSSSQWKKLRTAYRQQHPICEMCASENRVTPATEIHHISPISTGHTFAQMWALALDYNNLMSLCSDCHKQIHTDLKNSDK